MARTTPLWRRLDDAVAAHPYGVMDIKPAVYIREMSDRIPTAFYGAKGVKAWLSEEAHRADRQE
jgi:hypothetical protein